MQGAVVDAYMQLAEEEEEEAVHTPLNDIRSSDIRILSFWYTIIFIGIYSSFAGKKLNGQEESSIDFNGVWKGG